LFYVFFVLFYVFFVVICIFCVVLRIFCCSMYFCVVLCIFVLFYVFFVLFYVFFVLFYVFFCVVLCIFCVAPCIVCSVTFLVLSVCTCELNNCHRVATQLQLHIYHNISLAERAQLGVCKIWFLGVLNCLSFVKGVQLNRVTVSIKSVTCFYSNQNAHNMLNTQIYHRNKYIYVSQ
jgi:hypothetical protein